MFGRIVLGAIAAASFHSGFADMQISSRVPGEVPVFSPADVDKINPSSTPFVQIDGIPPADGVCIYTHIKDEPSGVKLNEGTYAPILTTAQVKLVSAGRPVVASAIVKLDDCNRDQTPKDVPSLVQGVVSRGKGQVPALYSNELKKQRISLSPNVLVVEQRGQRPTTASGVEQMIAGLTLFAFAIVPFFSRRRKLNQSRLSSCDLPSALEELRPLVSCSPAVFDSTSGMAQIFGDNEKEIILFRLNCDVEKIPSICVITNKRLLIYCTKNNMLPMMGRLAYRLIDKGADKVPFGGILISGIDPFFETYDVLFVREELSWRENLGFDDAEILENRVPWKKLSEFKFTELPAVISSVRASKDWFSRSANVSFRPRSIKNVFSLPKDFEISDFVALVVIKRVISETHPILAAAGCKVDAEAKSVTIELPVPHRPN